jgi:HJR/Mrr/RecB family endonuclease
MDRQNKEIEDYIRSQTEEDFEALKKLIERNKNVAQQTSGTMDLLRNILKHALIEDNRFDWKPYRKSPQFNEPEPVPPKLSEAVEPSQFNEPEPVPKLFKPLTAYTRGMKKIPIAPWIGDTRYTPDEDGKRLFAEDYEKWEKEQKRIINENERIFEEKNAKREKKNALLIQRYEENHNRWEKGEQIYLEENKIIVKEQNIQIEKKNAHLLQTYEENHNRWKLAKQAFDREQDITIKKRKQQYLQKEPDAVIEYCTLILENSEYPTCCPKEFDLGYNSETKILIVDYCLPCVEDLPSVKAVKNRETLEVKEIEQRGNLDGIDDDTLKRVTEEQGNLLLGYGNKYLRKRAKELMELLPEMEKNLLSPIVSPDFVKYINTVIAGYKIELFIIAYRLRRNDKLVEVHYSKSFMNELYDDVVYQISLRTVYELFESDSAKAFDSIVFNGWVKSIDRATGQKINSCILSLQVSRQEFQSLNFAEVDPKACFKHLKGIGSSKLHSLTPIAPVLNIDRADKRFVSSYEVAGSLEESTNIAAMHWEEFEHLIRELFEKEFSQYGGEVKITQASHDRGVDAVAFDPDPIRGGKIVIQAKRYTNVVGVAAVRDLYGTVINEGAMKGILISTADYGPDAYEFAKGKPLTLLNGGNLLHMLDKHGHKAVIDLKAAKLALSERD